MKSDFSVFVTLRSEEVKLRFRTMSYSNHATLYLLIKGPLSSRVLTFVRVSISLQVLCRWRDSLTDLSYFVHQDNNQDLNGSLRAMKSHLSNVHWISSSICNDQLPIDIDNVPQGSWDPWKASTKNEARSAQLRSLLKQTKTISCNIHLFNQVITNKCGRSSTLLLC